MSDTKIISLGCDFVVCTNNILDRFLGEKVILTNSTNSAFGVVIQIESENVVIQNLQDVEGFDILNTKVLFTNQKFTLDLSPTILGRKFNFAGEEIDNLGSILALDSKQFQFRKKANSSRSKEFLIPDALFKGESLVNKELNYLQKLEELHQEDIAIIVIGAQNEERKKLMKQTGLDQVAIWFETLNKKSKLWNQALELGFVAAEYIAKEFDFDVLILVDNWDDCSSSFRESNKNINSFCKPQIQIDKKPQEFLTQTFVSLDKKHSVSLLAI